MTTEEKSLDEIRKNARAVTRILKPLLAQHPHYGAAVCVEASQRALAELPEGTPLGELIQFAEGQLQHVRNSDHRVTEAEVTGVWIDAWLA